MIHRTLATLGMTLCLACAPLFANQPMAVSGEAYSGSKTLSLTLGPTAKGDKVLLQFTGNNHPWDGKLFMTSVRTNGNRKEYRIKNRGADYLLFREEAGNATLFLPGESDLSLYLDKGRSESISPLGMMHEFEAQEAATKAQK